MDADSQDLPDDPSVAPNTPSPPPPGDSDDEVARTLINRTPLSPVRGINDTSGGGVKAAPRIGAADAMIGKTIGHHAVSGVLGRGGMGVVYEATDSVLSRKVAIKMLPEALADDPTAEARFLQEARAVARLNHPNIVAIYEVGKHGESPYLVLEHVAGESMADALQKGPLHWRDATQVIAQACRGLAAAHAAGLLHRDIKPANLLRATDGTIKITDFGLAKNLQGLNKTLTKQGHVVGTPCFMSPEQCHATALDERSDIYSMGATYYSLLTGAGPYESAETASSILFAHCYKPVPDPHEANHAVPKPAAAIVRRAMAKDPAERYPSANAFLADLEALLAGKPPAALDKAYSPLPDPSGLSGLGITHDDPARDRLHSAFTRRHVIASVIGTAAVGAAAYAGWRAWKSKPRGAKSVAKSDEGTSRAIVLDTKNPVLVGILHSTSGDMAPSESGPRQGARLAIEELNENGGVLGRKIEPLFADGESNPTRFAERAEELITQKNVCTIFGCWSSAARKEVKNVVERHKNLLVYPIQFEGLERSPNIIYIGATANQQIEPAIAWLLSRHGKRFVHVGSDYIFPRIADALIEEYVERRGGELVGKAFVLRGSLNVQRLIKVIRDTKPDVVLNTINGETNRAFFQALRDERISSEGPRVCSFSLPETQIKELGSTFMRKGDYVAWSYFMSVDRPENAAFITRYQDYFRTNGPTSDPIESAYLAVHLWAKGVAKAGSTNPVEIRNAMLGQEFNAPEGRVKIDASNGYTLRTSRIGAIQADGSIQIEPNGAPEVSPDPFPLFKREEEWTALLELYHDKWQGWEARRSDAAQD